MNKSDLYPLTQIIYKLENGLPLKTDFFEYLLQIQYNDSISLLLWNVIS